MQLFITTATLLLVTSQKCDAIRSLFFQPNNVPSNETWAWQILTPTTTLEKADNFSVALWFKIHHFRDSTYLFSYAISDQKNNQLNFGVRDNYLFIVVGENSLSGYKNQSFVPEVWYHFALTYNDADRWYAMYINGKLHKSGKATKRTLYMNGSLVLGQETDAFNGDFNDMQSFSGQIADFNIWSRSLTADEVLSLTNCSGSGSGDMAGDIANLDNKSNWQLVGAVDEGNIPFQEICRRDSRALQIFPQHFKFKEAVDFCIKLKSDVFTPYTEALNTWAYDQIKEYVTQCQPKNHGSSFMWIGITDKEKEGTWEDLKGNLLNYTNFNSDANSKRQDCASYERDPDVYQWNDVLCGNTYNFCVSCYTEERTVYKMRGLCEEKKMSSWFLMETEIKNYKHFFRGFTKYSLQIQLSAENKTQWALVDMWQNNMTMATWNTHNSAYPLGLLNWTVTQDYLLCDKPLGHKMMLSLSSCYPEEFTCNEGTCVDITKRCNLRADCPDASDEIGCEKVLMPSEYIPSLPPPGPDDSPLGVNISINIRAFSAIDIRNMIIKVDMIVKTSWLESRLKYKNLRMVQDINYVEPKLVWTPHFDLLNADFPEVHRTDPSITVIRRTGAVPDDVSMPVHDEIFLGQENPLEMKMKVNAPFTCDMDLKNFPFDIQYCTLQFQMSSVRADFAIWENVDIFYGGERLLTEYEVGELRTGHRIEGLHSIAVVQVPLYGRYWFYVTSSYLPIMMLVVISYASLFCRHENPDLRIMMALTALLVLYALYQQISEGLPKTSYTKAVDVWCFFAITLIFSQVVFHVAIDLPVWPRFCQLRRRRNSVVDTIKGVHETDSFTSTQANAPDVSKLLYYARIVYVVVFLIFFVIYWSFVLTKKMELENNGLDI